MESTSEVLGSHSARYWKQNGSLRNNGKIEHEDGLNF